MYCKISNINPERFSEFIDVILKLNLRLYDSEFEKIPKTGELKLVSLSFYNISKHLMLIEEYEL